MFFIWCELLALMNFFEILLKGYLASEARQAVGRTLVGKYGWEVGVCGQPGRFARLSTYPR